MRWWIAAVLTALVVLGACGDDDDDPTATPGETGTPERTASAMATEGQASELGEARCPFDVPSGEDVTCGVVRVPEDREDDGSGEVSLSVAVFKARGENPEPDPIVYLDGGPGGNTLETIGLAFDSLIDPYLDERDFVLFDQRGAGYSDPALECPELDEAEVEALETGPETEEYVTASLAALTECRTRLVGEDINTALANSAESAADVEALREALGYEEWNLYGVSYGTRLALTVLRDYPDGVRSVILDSVFPVEEELLTALAPNFDRALRTLFEGCAADEECSEDNPDLEAVLFETVEALNAEPAEVEVLLGLLGGDLDEMVLTGDLFLSLVFQSFYSAQLIPSLPDLISATNEGDYFLVGLLAATFVEQRQYVSAGMYVSVQCTEDAPFVSVEDAEAALAAHADIRGAFLGEPELSADSCEIWDAPPADDVEDEAVESDVPALVLAGAYDPITPPTWGQQVAETLGTAHYFEFPDQGHAPSVGSNCAAEVVSEFLDDPEGEPAAACVDELGPPDFGGIPFF